MRGITLPRSPLSAVVCVNLLVFLASSPALAQMPTPAPSNLSRDNVTPYLTPQRVVAIAPRRSINLVCLGEGSPTIILTAGLGGWSQVWYRIQESLSRTTRSCAWDPAGLGFSSPSPEPQDAVHKTADLEAALRASQINGPYVMVAHSAGSYVALLFSDRNPRSVAGMVLVDPSIPDEVAIRERMVPDWGTAGGVGPSADAERLKRCAAKLENRLIKQGMPDFDACVAQPMPEAFSSLAAKLSELNADPERLLTQASALGNALADSSHEAISLTRNYGDMPLVVLSSGQHPLPPNMPSKQRQQLTLYFQALITGHKALAALSTRGSQRFVPDSGHFIQFDNPEAVLSAINHVVAAIH